MGTIAQKLEYLNDTRLLLKDNINKINNVLTDNSTFRSYPQELFNGYLDVLNNGTDTLWNNLEKVSQTGTEAVLENVETAPIKMVLNGNTSQDGEPTPDTPVEVKVVTGENVVSVQGKNKFSTDYLDTYTYDTYTQLGKNSFEFTATTSWKTGRFKVPCKPNTDYYFNLKQDLSISTRNVYITIRGVQTNKMIYELYVGYLKAFNSGENTELLISIQTGNGVLSGKIYDIQLEEGTAKTDFIPYSHTDYPINLGDIELCKINTYKDFPFKAINGNEYYDTLTDEQKNALVYGKWYVHKEIEKKIFDGSEDETWQLMYGNTESYFYRYRYIDDRLASSDKSYFSNYYAVANPAISSTNTSQGLTIISLNELRIRYGVVGTIENFKTWLSTHNLIVYYVLATPTEEEITNTTLIEQLEAIYKAKSVKDKTYITQTNDDLPFILDVEAIKEYEVN